MHSTASRPSWTVVPALIWILFAGGCQTIGYYSHAVAGQWHVLTSREPVTEVLASLAHRRAEDPEGALLYQRLTFSQQVVDFARDELRLDVGRRYRTYVDLDRPAVVWNVFAAPPLSLDPHTWCYPFVGCAPYRGYFDRNRAERQADSLAAQGLETYVGAVAAYSTLGWFADPLLSTFITWPEPDLAELLFHELAHGEVWVAGDVAFNESFATFVGRQGLAAWLGHRGQQALLQERAQLAADRARFLDLLERTRAVLGGIYESPADRATRLEQKARVLEGVRDCYAAHRALLGGGRYDALMAGLDNARLVSVATYEDLVPGFARLFDAVGGDWSDFYQRVRALGELDERTRLDALQPGGDSGDEQVAQGGDHHGPHEIQCQALARHFLDAEAAG